MAIRVPELIADMAARLDGDVVELGDAYIPADAVETRALRAGSLTGLLGDTLAATHLTAAWVHGVLSEPPSPHTVQRAVPRRLHHVPSRHLVYRDLAVDPADLVSIGGIRVTTPLRTLEDLCRVGDDAHTRAARLLAMGRSELVDAARWPEPQATWWKRDRALLEVAGRARAARLDKAWERLSG